MTQIFEKLDIIQLLYTKKKIISSILIQSTHLKFFFDHQNEEKTNVCLCIGILLLHFIEY